MVPQREILLIEHESTHAALRLVQRLSAVGFRATRAQSARKLRQLVDRPSLPFRAALLGTSLLGDQVFSLLAPLRQHLASGEMTGLAVGDAPAPAIRDRLREAGFTLALWHPFDDRTLRFQVNRAFLRARGNGPARGELRAPLPWRVSVRGFGGRREAHVYSLSEGGAFLETTRPLTVGAEIEVEFPLPLGQASVPASVVHTNVPGDLLRPHVPLGMGIRFASPSPTVVGEFARIVVERSRDLLV